MIGSVQLRRCARVVNGGTPTNKEDNWGGPIPWATPEDLGASNGMLLSATRRTLTAKGIATSSANVVPPQSIVVSTRAPIGHVAISAESMAFNQGCRALVPRDRTEPRFLFYAVLAYRRALKEEGRGSTFTELSGQQLASFYVHLPKPNQQRLIADFLDRETHRIDALVDTKQRLIQALLAKREVLTLAAATGALLEGHVMKESSLPWAMSVPRHWDEALLNKVARMGSGHTPSRSRSEWWEDGTIPWITTGEVQQIRDDRIEYLTETREKVSLIGLANSSAVLHPKGAVLLSRTASAGFSGIMGTDMATSQDFVTWTCGPQITPRFLLLCLRAMRRDLLERLAQGSTHQTIYMPDIASIKVPLPPIEEQKSIVERFWRVASMIDAAVDNLSLQLDLLAEYRQALITQAVTGQLDEATLKGDKPVGEAVGVIPE